MIVLPAIDLFEGTAVRLLQGDYERKEEYGDPLDAAKSYEAAGATHLHIVDLGAARSGVFDRATYSLVSRIMSTTYLKVEIGGGIRSKEDLERWYDAGVWRCVLGTAAVRNLDFAQEMIHLYGDRVIVGIDSKEGYVASSGWTYREQIRSEEFGRVLKGFGLQECIYTDISRDGMMSGINQLGALTLAQQTGLKVIVSGGVKDLGDIDAIVEKQSEGLSGVVLGKALYEGRLSLVDVLAHARMKEV